jgi:hypothetical protein
LKEILNDKNIEWEKSVSFAQDQNDVSEKAIRTVIEKARILLIAANLSKRLWSKALIIVCYFSNRSSIKALDEKMTSYEAWHDEKSNLSNLRMYDCKAYVIDYHAKEKDKMTKRAWIDTLIDYEIKNQWRIYDEKSFLFDETSFLMKQKWRIKALLKNQNFCLIYSIWDTRMTTHFDRLETMKMINQWRKISHCKMKILNQKIRKIRIKKMI